MNVVTLGSFTKADFFISLKHFINTNTWKLRRSSIGEISHSNDAGVFTMFEHFFNIGCDGFSIKELTSSYFEIFWLLTKFERRVFKFTSFLASCVKMLSPTKDIVAFEEFLLENKALINLQNCLLSTISLSFKISDYYFHIRRLISYARRFWWKLTTNFSKTVFRKLLNFCQETFLIMILVKNM